MSGLAYSGPTSRRQLLKAMAAGGLLAASGGVVSSCNSGLGSGGSDVTLTTYENWPYGAMPSAKEQKDDPGQKAYAEALKTWMDDNPGVTIKNVDLNVWDQEALTTAITGGTAPSAFPGDVVGGWDRANVRSAMAQGLTADVTELLESYDVESKLADYVKPIWKHWAVDGKFYAAPWLYNVGTGIHYRVDLIRELGLKEPTPDWTWDDVRELAMGLTEGKRKGIVLQAWGLNLPVSADGMDFHAQVPTPNTNWNWSWDYMSKASYWTGLIEGMREMVFEDKSVLADISLADGDVLAAFFRGDAAMHNNTVVFFTLAPGSENSPADLAAKLDKPIEEVMGWMTQPLGRNGRAGGTQGQVDLVGFSPDLDDDELDKAVSLLMYMHTDGWVTQRKAAYDSTKDPKRVYDVANMMPLMKGNIDKVPSSPDEAWGKPFMDQVRRAAEIPIAPNEAFYFPPELSAAPTSTARDDMTSRWANERGALDLAADLQKLEDTLNKQAESFTSSTADDEFTKAAKSYFEEHAAYWQANAPDYYENFFQEWYESSVRPALGG